MYLKETYIPQLCYRDIIVIMLFLSTVLNEKQKEYIKMKKQETLPTDNKEDGYENPISSGSEYSAKSEFSKPRLALEAVQRCLIERAKEMKAGYFNIKFDQMNMPHRVWIPDQREVFNSSIESLKSLLSPEIESSKDYMEGSKEIEKEMEDLFDKYCYTEFSTEDDGSGRVLYKKTTNKYMPMKDEMVIVIQGSPGGKMIAKELVGGWNRKVDFYLDGMVKLNDKLFSGMNQLIDSLNYFKSGRSFGKK